MNLLYCCYILNMLICVSFVYSSILEDDYSKQDTDYFEPNNPLKEPKPADNTTAAPNIDCEDFSSYTTNCTIEASLIYNSTRKSLPPPVKFDYWCRSIKMMTNCATKWNNDCKHVTESHFNEDSINGHNHVVTNLCNDASFVTSYKNIARCIQDSSYGWEDCYVTFKEEMDKQKQSNQPMTHFKTHFNVCCARARFRACTLSTAMVNCTNLEALTIQKFSVITSEGEVFMECDSFVQYPNCPGGDPRPDPKQLMTLTKAFESDQSADKAKTIGDNLLLVWLGFILYLYVF